MFNETIIEPKKVNLWFVKTRGSVLGTVNFVVTFALTGIVSGTAKYLVDTYGWREVYTLFSWTMLLYFP